MATLIRSKNTSPSPPSTLLYSTVPTPFPREQLEKVSISSSRQDDTAEVAKDPFEDSVEHDNPFKNGVTAGVTAVESGVETPNTLTLKEVMPSIVHVQKTCLMTLNNLLSEPVGWHPIVPPRRHSMPSTPVVTSAEDEFTSTSALNTLVSNLRNRVADGEMIEARVDGTEADLLRELRIRVESISSLLIGNDAALARALVDLLTNLHHLSDMQTSVSQVPSHISKLGKISINAPDKPPPIDVYDTLSRQLSDLQIERLSSQASNSTQQLSTPAVAFEASLLWSQIDAELEKVVLLCKQRFVTLPRPSHDYLPPKYDGKNYDDLDLESLPDYEAKGRISLEEPKSPKAGSFQSQQTSRAGDEKMRMDLEAVAMAIERLYIVTPQLHNQRVELKSSKMAELAKLELAKAEASSRASSLAKGKERDVKELEKIVQLIGKASERSYRNQSVILDGDMQNKLEKAKRDEIAKRDAFVEQLLHHSEAGRIHSQDAVLQIRDPEALLSLPEFIREPLPQSERSKDLLGLVSLPEFVREPVPSCVLPQKLEQLEKHDSKQRSRSRSSSAPPLAWLRSSAARAKNASLNHDKKLDSKGKSKLSNTGFDVVYVAENHENLHHILVFFNITSGMPNAEVQAEIMPPLLNLPMDGGDHLLIKSGPHTSLPLMLPAHTTSGKGEVRVQRGHYEIKLITTHSSPSPSDKNAATMRDSGSGPLLDSSQLLHLKPTAFVCSSCTLPVIQSNKVDSYRDLPSEHWEELVEAWMCHGDQKLNDDVAKHSKRGLWPSIGHALVGGSYILFEEGAMNTTNLHISSDHKSNDDWRLVRCLCGALLGRCQERTLNHGLNRMYRVLKYAVRPICPSSEPIKIPLSAFVVEDMMEFVQAHASYRFVIRDEEEERPRMLIWLFKPKIQLAYTAARHHVIPKSANILAAKVLYKLLKPNEQHADIQSLLNKYPGFPQAEYLSYPMSACRHIAAMLNDSNSAYPEGLRTMTGLQVGWLQRK